MAEATKSKVPSELIYASKWDNAFSTVATSTSIGFFASVFVSLVIFRRPSFRLGNVLLGTGMGIGWGAKAVNDDFAAEAVKNALASKNA